MSERTSKIAIVGAGSVGATIAYACMIRGVGKHIALYDMNEKKVEAECLDLNHGLQFVPMATIEGSADVNVCKDADIIVITAGAKQKPGQTRLDLAGANAEICRKLLPGLIKVSPESILLVVTNPVDVITYITLKLSGYPRNRVLGSGTVLDSSRFRFLIARRLKVAVQNVHAHIAGEHGDSEIPLWSSASIANIPLHDWAVMHHGKLSVRDRVEIFENVKDAAQQIIAGKGATNYAIGLATAKILEALLHDENRVLAVSSLIEDFHGISDVCLSIPSIVNRQGVEPPLPVPLNANEEAGLRNSADTIRATIRSLGF
ncbi:MAG TPA: L-lactate dehydrogenase [Tepidisphaeraceae bacterium]|jgi:L-lactate dehydrogenase|nr:L-lactate dehydrogenase [Tepidisphaeraceae bacterium]